MLSRKTQDNTQSDIETRAAHLFYTQISSVIPEIEKITKKRLFVFHDAYDGVRKNLFELKSVLGDFHKKLINEENNRKQYAVPSYLNKANRIAREILEDANRKYTDAMKDDADKKKRLLMEREFLRSNLALEEGKFQTFRSNGGSAAIDRYAKLQNDQADLLRKQSDLERKIDKKCCGSLPWRANKEGEALKEVESKLRNVGAEMTVLSKSVTNFEVARSRLAKAEADLAAVEQLILSHLTEGPQKIREASERVRVVEIKHAETEVNIEKDKARHYAAVSAALMDDIQHIYGLFIKLKKELDLLHPDGKISFAKDRVDELMMQITSPEQDNKSANILYLEARGNAIDITSVADIISIR